MRTIETKLYKFNELPEDIKEKALDNMRHLNIHDKWWDFLEEDMSEINLKLDSFDIDRGSFCKLEFIDSAESTAHLIETNHGESCDTFIETKLYLKDRDKLINNWPKDENNDLDNVYELDQELDELDSDYLKEIQSCYLITLRKEYEYLSSDESIKENIECNEYEFTKEGGVHV